MPSTIDKAIIANRGGMEAKYGPAGASAIYAALDRLIAADAKRGHATVVVNIDDDGEMAPFGGTAIVNAADQWGAKQAVDAIDGRAAPDYFMLLDGPDVIPHIALDALPGLDDSDKTIPSDLPYACDAAFSTNASDFLAATRVVGRLPMAAGTADADAFVGLIDRCAAHAPRPVSAFAEVFAISTEAWKASTKLSLSALFGKSSALQTAPSATHDTINDSLNSLVHFINCHGATADPQFYGEKSKKFPVAMHSPQVAPHIRPGTLAAVECCYGAELYDFGLLGAGQPICMSYLLGGALAYLGSTNIAYGPAASNGQADLITRYFLEDALKGASTGRAMLQARQRFVSSQSMSDQTNLKTLAQFVLYGDPSLLAVEPPPVAVALAAASADSMAKNRASGRKARRVLLKSSGMACASSASFPGRQSHMNPAMTKRVEALAEARGYRGEPRVFDVSGGADFRKAAKVLDRKQKVAILCNTTESHHSPVTGKPLPVTKVLVAHILGDGIVAVNECESR